MRRAVLVFPALGLFVVACEPAPPPPPPVTSTAAAQPGISSGPPRNAFPDSTRACTSADLNTALGPPGFEAEYTYQPVDFTNTSDRTCALSGYPVAFLADGALPKQVGPAAIPDGGSPQQVVLAPGRGARATVVYLRARDCETVPTRYLMVQPPNQTAVVPLAFAADACVSPPQPLLRIDVVKPAQP
ncbi:DUF4232 domain-containing protein [Nocardia sp. NPDC048505]|uniref:DUF4232 domain-containing protein n=1 Tax=unclassified Nocardia TaxID=2637762 RepID=UPI00340EAF51